MKKYGLLIYQYISAFQVDFEVISLPWNNVEVWPHSEPIAVQDGAGQTQYQWPLTTMFKIVEHSDWGQDQTNAINNAVAAWNAANEDRQIPESLQLIFTPEEATGISAIFEAERQRLIESL